MPTYEKSGSCCCSAPVEPCSYCTSNTPNTIEITISGVVDATNCTDCPNINGLWILTRQPPEYIIGCCVWLTSKESLIDCTDYSPSIQNVFVDFTICASFARIRVSADSPGVIGEYNYPSTQSDCSLYEGTFADDSGATFRCNFSGATYDVVFV